MFVTKTEYLSCPRVTPCQQSQPVIKLNGDLANAYVLLKSELAICSAQTMMIYDCQSKLNKEKQSMAYKEN